MKIQPDETVKEINHTVIVSAPPASGSTRSHKHSSTATIGLRISTNEKRRPLVIGESQEHSRSFEGTPSPKENSLNVPTERTRLIESGARVVCLEPPCDDPVMTSLITEDCTHQDKYSEHSTSHLHEDGWALNYNHFQVENLCKLKSLFQKIFDEFCWT